MTSRNIKIKKEQLIDLIKALNSNEWSKEDENALKDIVEKLLSYNIYNEIINSNLEEFSIINNDLLDKEPDLSLGTGLPIPIDPDAFNNLLQTAILCIKCMPAPDFTSPMYPNIERAATILVEHWKNINLDQATFTLTLGKVLDYLLKKEGKE